MTFDEIYKLIVMLAAGGLGVTIVGLVVEWWLKMRGNRAERRARRARNRELTDFIRKHFDDKLITPTEMQRRMVDSLYPVDYHIAVDLALEHDLAIVVWTRPARGTVQNPMADPSPTPRRNRT